MVGPGLESWGCGDRMRVKSKDFNEMMDEFWAYMWKACGVKAEPSAVANGYSEWNNATIKQTRSRSDIVIFEPSRTPPKKFFPQLFRRPYLTTPLETPEQSARNTITTPPKPKPNHPPHFSVQLPIPKAPIPYHSVRKTHHQKHRPTNSFETRKATC